MRDTRASDGPFGRRRRWWIGVLLIAILLATILAIVPAKSTGAQTKCGSIQARVDAAPKGATVDLPDGCLYRETVVIDKPLTLKGGPGVEIRGSEVWTSWNRKRTKRGTRWVSEARLPSFSSHGYCKPKIRRCKWPEQVFIDGKQLRQVASDLKRRRFALTRRHRVILANNPTGHTVEVTVRRSWIVGKSGGVTIEGFTMKHAANDAQSGAIANNGHPNWTVKGNDLSYAHGANVTLGGDTTGLRIENNDVHHAGQFGISSNGSELEVIGNEIHHNNTEGFDPSWAAGGMKITDAKRLLASGNEVYNNDQTGIWTDTGSENITLSNNHIHHNPKQGVRLEITDHAKVFGNTLYKNGWGYKGGGPGVSVGASRDVEVYNNTLAWNRLGVVVVNSKRERGVGATDRKFDKVYDVHVHHNTILMAKDSVSGEHFALAWRKAYSRGNIYQPAANNRGYDNKYWYPKPEGSHYRFLWNGKFKKLRHFNATLGEEGGRYLSDAEKQQVSTSEGVPAKP